MSDKRIIRAAAVQIAPDLERSGGTLDKVCAAIDCTVASVFLTR